MKLCRRIFAAAFVLCLLLSLCPAAWAEETDTRFDNKTWDEVIDTFLNAWGVKPESVTMGYYNTVTGEEHYYNPDQYMVTGSMYKVPLNMAWAEKVYNGEMEMDSPIGSIKYSDLQKGSIVYSDNDYARTLWEALGDGTYHRYRELIAPYMGEDPATVDAKYYENNFFTARQMIHCLRLLAEEPERYPGVIEAMQRAEPSEYFKRKEQRFDIGHKYGFLQTEYHLYMNDCAIAYTDDPIVFVLFTDNVNKAYDVMADFCTLMCDYAQYHTAERLRLEEEARKAEAAAWAEAERQAAVPVSVTLPEPGETAPEPEESRLTTRVWLSPFLLGVLVVVLMLAAVAVCFRLWHRRGLGLGWGLAAVVLTGGTLLLCIPAYSGDAILAKPQGEPQQTVTVFFDALTEGDYPQADACLQGEQSLGLAAQPEGAQEQRLLAALQESYSYQLFGDCSVEGLTAHQQVGFRYLDVSSLETDFQTEARAALSELRQENPETPEDELIQAAYDQALDTVLAHPETYYATTGLQVELTCTPQGWRIVPRTNLLRVIAGGLG